MSEENIEEYKVNLNSIHLYRKSGVSGMMRVKNDAEFVEASIESCINALDELVIVYNGCSDNSPEIIRQIASRYPNKIKVYEYRPEIYSHNLSDVRYQQYVENTIDPIHTLANYYNYALSKTQYKYVLKIDADQIYFTEELKDICDLYRRKYYTKIPSIKSFTNFYNIYSYLKGGGKTKSDNNYPVFYESYVSVVRFLACIFGFPISLSGINMLFSNNVSYIPLGMVNNNLNILPPFNGVGDHLIFKVTKRTVFRVYDCPEYNLQTSTKHTVIERLDGIRHYLFYGFCWIHLNMNRIYIKNKQEQNIKEYPDCYIKLSDLRNKSDDELKSLLWSRDNRLFSSRNKRIFNFIFAGSKNKIFNMIENHIDICKLVCSKN